MVLAGVLVSAMAGTAFTHGSNYRDQVPTIVARLTQPALLHCNPRQINLGNATYRWESQSLFHYSFRRQERHPETTSSLNSYIPDGAREQSLGMPAAVAERSVADLQFCGDLGQRNAFEPAAADQVRLGRREHAVPHRGGQDEVGVAPGHRWPVAGLVELTAPAGIVGIGVGQGLPGPESGPVQP
jgi:hypothetical protein